jgi:uncharacterized protein YndB with AHSA1/START domain
MSDTADRELVISRVFDAPRELVFQAWMSPKHLDAWWGPHGFKTITSSMDASKGGAWLYIMRHDQYGEFKNRIIYREIVKPERLEYTHDSGVDGDPAAFEVTVTFTAQGARTKVMMRSLFPNAAELQRVKGFGAAEGGNQTLERLGTWLAEHGE